MTKHDINQSVDDIRVVLRELYSLEDDTRPGSDMSDLCNAMYRAERIERFLVDLVQETTDVQP